MNSTTNEPPPAATIDDQWAWCHAAFDNLSVYKDNVHGYLVLVICAVGMLSNSANIAVFTRQQMSSSPINFILTSIAIADTMVIMEYVPFNIHMYVWTGDRKPVERFSWMWSAVVLFHVNFSIVMHTVSIALTLVLAVWRFVMIRFPAQAREYCTRKTCNRLVIAALVIPIFLNSPNYVSTTIKGRSSISSKPKEQSEIVAKVNTTMTNHTEYQDESDSEEDEVMIYFVKWSDLSAKNDRLIYRINMWLNSVALKLVPCIILSIFTGCLIHALYRAETKSSNLRHTTVHHMTQVGSMPGLGGNRQSLQVPGRDLEIESQSAVDQTEMQTLCQSTASTAIDEAGKQDPDELKIVQHKGNLAASSRIASPKRATSISLPQKPESDGGKVDQRKSRTDKTTRLLVAILVLFLVTELPQGILALLSAIYGDRFFASCYYPLGELMDLTALFNAAINFFVYYSMSEQFRSVFMSLFSKREIGTGRSANRHH